MRYHILAASTNAILGRVWDSKEKCMVCNFWIPNTICYTENGLCPYFCIDKSWCENELLRFIKIGEIDELSEEALREFLFVWAL